MFEIIFNFVNAYLWPIPWKSQNALWKFPMAAFSAIHCKFILSNFRSIQIIFLFYFLLRFKDFVKRLWFFCSYKDYVFESIHYIVNIYNIKVVDQFHCIIVLRCVALHGIVLYCIISYCILLYCIVFERPYIGI
jgi:hypothetical protein